MADLRNVPTAELVAELQRRELRAPKLRRHMRVNTQPALVVIRQPWGHPKRTDFPLAA
jgi:hypothetical protein